MEATSLRDIKELNYIEDIYNACKKGDLARVKYWLTQEVGISNTYKEWDENTKTGAERTPLFYVAREGHLDIVCILLASGAEVNKGRIDYGTTPLYIAAE